MDRSPVCATVIEAGKQLGLEHREDVNDLPPAAGLFVADHPLQTPDALDSCERSELRSLEASLKTTDLCPIPRGRALSQW